MNIRFIKLDLVAKVVEYLLKRMESRNYFFFLARPFLLKSLFTGKGGKGNLKFFKKNILDLNF